MLGEASVVGVDLNVFGILVGAFVGNFLQKSFSPQFHGAGQPQHPTDKVFISWEKAEQMDVVAKVLSWAGGAILGGLLGPEIAAAATTEWQKIGDIEKAFVVSFVVFFVLLVHSRVYRAAHKDEQPE